MQALKSLTAPTTVTHSLYCNFTGRTDPDLLVVRGSNLLQLFKTVRAQTHIVNDAPADRAEQQDAPAIEERLLEGQDTFIGSETTLEAAREEFSVKLVLVAEWQLQGQVTGLDKISTLADTKRRKTARGAQHSVLVSFKYAKMSIVSWDPLQQAIATQSLHYYEKDLFDSDFVDPMFPARLAVEPDSAAATLLYQHDTFVFLPFARDELLDDAIVAPNTQNGATPASGPALAPIYKPSFMIQAIAMHESITNVVDFAYLHEYREPTLAVLYEPTRTWAGRLQLGKDTVSYMVLSLDLQSQSFTSIISVNNLPYNVRSIVPLRDPIGGSLLIGTNEFIHIDSQGRVNGVFVNALHTISSALDIKDQSDMQLSLESCVAAQLDSGAEDQVCVVLESGDLLMLHFHIESRKVHEMTVSRATTDIKVPNPTLITLLKTRYILIGSTSADSQLIQWKRQGEITADDDTKTAVPALKPVEEAQPGTAHDDIDDIYGDMPKKTKATAITGYSDLPIVFRPSDRLNNYGPINDMITCRAPKEYNGGDKGALDIVAATGTGTDKSLTVFTRKLRATIASTLKLKNNFSRIWTLRPASLSAGDSFDTYLVGSNDTDTFVFKIGEEFEDISATVSRLKSSGPTLACATIFNGQNIVFVCATAVFLFDSSLAYLTRKKLKTPPTRISFAEEHIVVTFDEDTHAIFEIKEKTRAAEGAAWDISERTPSAKLPPAKALYTGTSAVFSTALMSDKKRIKRKLDDEEVVQEQREFPVPLMYSVGKDSATLHASYLIDSTVRFDLSALLHLPYVLRLEGRTFVDDNATGQAGAPIDVEQIVHFTMKSEIEQDDEEEYLAILASGSLYITLYRFVKTDNTTLLVKYRSSTFTSLSLAHAENARAQMVPFSNVGGYSGLFVLGAAAHIIFKPAHGPVMYHEFAVPGGSAVLGFTPFNTPSVYSGLAYIDGDYVLRIAALPTDTVDLASAWPARRVQLGAPVLSLAYHEQGNVVAVGVIGVHEYDAQDPDGNPIADLNSAMPRPVAYRSTLKLVSPAHGWKVIDEVEYGENETLMTVKSVLLEVSERTRQRKEFLVAGTAIVRGEDLAAQGGFYIYEAVEVVPEPGRPETSHKLKQVTSEMSKGAVTSVCEVSGHLLIAQAQKVVVRNIQEDNSVVPVAFMDMNMYVSESKSLKYMVLLSDAVRSVWLVGFGKEPYRMTLFGKDYRDIEVTACEFVVFNKTLHVLVADTQQRLHVLQYDPEDPSPVSGQSLLRRSEVFVGRDVGTMLLLGCGGAGSGGTAFAPICGARDGALLAAVPVAEATYRALYVVQQQMAEREEHALGLNPRMHRALGVRPATYAAGVSGGSSSSRVLLDFDLVRRFGELPQERRTGYARRLGKTGEADVWGGLRAVGGAFGYM